MVLCGKLVTDWIDYKPAWFQKTPLKTGRYTTKLGGIVLLSESSGMVLPAAMRGYDRHKHDERTRR